MAEMPVHDGASTSFHPRYRFRQSSLYWPGSAFAVPMALIVPILVLDIPTVLALVWAAFWIGQAYFLFLRVAYELEFDGDTLRWRSPLRRGEVNLRGVLRVASGPGTLPLVTFSVADGSSIMVSVRRGLHDFTEVLVQQRPELSVYLNMHERLIESLGLRSGFEVLGE
jgi:hypothetical protein